MKDRLLNFLLIFLTVYLLLFLFFPKNDVNNIDTWIKISTQKSYTVPADVKISISNNTPEDVLIDTCSDLEVKKDWNIIKQENCWETIFKTWETKIIDFSNQYKDFYDVWSYFVLLKSQDKELLAQFEVKYKWFFSKIFIFLFYAPIYNLMAFLLEITNYSLGLAIIIVTIIIRIILIYPQHKMMISQKKMQLIQPKVKEVQEKFKWNQQALWMELMNLYKKEWVNPMWSCGLLLIQMPILIVIYHVIIWIQTQSNNYYLYNLLWDYNLVNINSIFFWLDLFGQWGLNWILIALVVAILQFIQVKLSLSYNKNTNQIVKNKPKEWIEAFMPDPEVMNKFMLYWLPIMIWIATYTFFAWVGLYWWVWTIFMIFQQLFVNKILKK